MPNLTELVYKLHCSETALSVLHSSVGFTKDPEIWGLLKKQCIVSDSPADKNCELRYLTVIRGAKNNKALCRMTGDIASECFFSTQERPRDEEAPFMDMLYINTYKAYMTAIQANVAFNSLLAKSEPIPLGYLYDGDTNYTLTELVIDDEIFNTCESNKPLNYGDHVRPIFINRYLPSTEFEKVMWREIAITK